MLNDIFIIFFALSGAAIIIWCIVQIREAMDPKRLIKAIHIGNDLKIRKMLKRGAPVDLETDNGTTPLIYAARSGRVHICELLIEYKADVNHMDHQGVTALMEASALGHSTIVQLLLKNGAEPAIQDKVGRTALSLAEAGENPEIRDLLAQQIRAA